MVPTDFKLVSMIQLWINRLMWTLALWVLQVFVLNHIHIYGCITPMVAVYLITLFPSVADSTGNITDQDITHVNLAAGYYLVSYSVSAIFPAPSYMQITPFYNGTTHLETGVYFATNADGSSACGSAHFILVAPSPTVFSLTYSGPLDARDGTATLTFLKLRPPA